MPVYCEKCGTEPGLAIANYCPDCGGHLVRKYRQVCPRCGTRTDNLTKYCTGCGIKVSLFPAFGKKQK